MTATPSPPAGTGGELATLMAGDAGERSLVERALAAARTHLGMEIAYASEFVGDEAVFHSVEAPGLEHLIRPGDRRSLDDVYCRHILAGRLPELIPDTAAEPLAVAMPITAAASIGAHVSVPLRLSDGRTYGMFCCLSPNADATLNARDLATMRAFADMAVFDIERTLRADADRDERRARIAGVLEGGAIASVYQPIWSLEAERPMGFEALSRFTAEPARAPDLWFAEAAGVGLGVELEIAAVAVALDALSALPAPVYLSVNVSPDCAGSDDLAALLADHPGERLVLEITEHEAIADYDALVDRLAPYRARGVRVAIDDAGSGYAGLEHVVRLSPDIVKLDRFLVDGIDADPARRSLAAALVRFARDTSAVVVAEGVETLAQLTVLRALGIDRIQGYLLGRPGTLDAARALMEQESALRIA